MIQLSFVAIDNLNCTVLWAMPDAGLEVSLYRYVSRFVKMFHNLDVCHFCKMAALSRITVWICVFQQQIRFEILRADSPPSFASITSTFSSRVNVFRFLSDITIFKKVG